MKLSGNVLFGTDHSTFFLKARSSGVEVEWNVPFVAKTTQLLLKKMWDQVACFFGKQGWVILICERLFGIIYMPGRVWRYEASSRCAGCV